MDAQADLHLCCSHMAKTGFLMTWLIYSMIFQNMQEVLTFAVWQQTSNDNVYLKIYIYVHNNKISLF